MRHQKRGGLDNGRSRTLTSPSKDSATAAFPLPCRECGSPATASGSCTTPALTRSSRTSHDRDGAADHGAGRAAGTDLLRPGDHRLRHRHLRRPLPRDQRRDPRRDPEPPPPLRRRQDLRLPLRLRGAGEAPRPHPARAHPRGGGPASASWGARSSPPPAAPRTRRRWSIPWRSWGSASSSPSAATAP